MHKIDFGKPYLRIVHLVRKYELDGVAFVEGFDKTVGFTFYSQTSSNLNLELADQYQSRYVYLFFVELFKEYAKTESGLSRYMHVDWELTGEKEIILTKIEEKMNSDWKKAFATLFSAHKPE